MLPSTQTSPPTPTPPATVNAPVVVPVEAVDVVARIVPPVMVVARTSVAVTEFNIDCPFTVNVVAVNDVITADTIVTVVAVTEFKID